VPTRTTRNRLYVGQLRSAHGEPSSRFTKSVLVELFWACGDDAVARSAIVRLTPSASAKAALATAQSVLERRGYLWEPTAEAFPQPPHRDETLAGCPRATGISIETPEISGGVGFVVNLGPLIAMQMRREFRAVHRAVERALRSNGLAV